jgi:hypothetical protein
MQLRAGKFAYGNMVDPRLKIQHHGVVLTNGSLAVLSSSAESNSQILRSFSIEKEKERRKEGGEKEPVKEA